jgi:2,3,4,5-tetrahydropyridine-2-carboxylate N-succinyltransferase
MDQRELRARIEALVADPSGLRGAAGDAVDETIAALDEGRLRVCEPGPTGWVTHEWLKEAILLYFRRLDIVPIGGAFDGAASAHRREPPSYYDRLPTKRNYAELGARCVPPAVARYGSFLGRGAIMMPSFVNIGAYVDERTMVDTWATVGSCAQIGKDVHLSGGVGIGGVLEPPQAQPVIVEDGAFIGSRCIVVEGVRVGVEAVLGAGVVLTASTPIIDVRSPVPKIAHGYVEARSVVIPGTTPKRFPGGVYGVPCALVIGERTASTDRKTSLERALRDHGVSV